MHNNRETIETRICELLAQGHSLAAICRRKNLPAPSTIYKWLAESPGFSERYAHAREQQGKHGFCPSPIQGAIRARARTTGSNDTVFMRRASGSDTRTRANNRALPYVHTARSQGAIRARARTTGVELQSIRHWPAGAIRARARTTGRLLRRRNHRNSRQLPA